MTKRKFLFWSGALASSPVLLAEERNDIQLNISLNPASPGKSLGKLLGDKNYSFAVGLGRNGVTPAGSSFRGGSSLLGDFRINGILSSERFEMDHELIKQSGKTEAWLSQNLFKNMSSIDFDNDGRGQEYGDAFIGLEPINSTAKQPFHFGYYKGVFRWYSYAIHGTQNESRIGKCITGGCINVGKADLKEIVATLKVGDRVSIN